MKSNRSESFGIHYIYISVLSPYLCANVFIWCCYCFICLKFWKKWIYFVFFNVRHSLSIFSLMLYSVTLLIFCQCRNYLDCVLQPNVEEILAFVPSIHKTIASICRPFIICYTKVKDEKRVLIDCWYLHIFNSKYSAKIR